MIDVNNSDDMNIDVEARGVDTTTRQFNQLLNVLDKVTSQVDRLSSRITVLMRNFSKLSGVVSRSNLKRKSTKKASPFDGIEGFVKETKYDKGYLENANLGNFTKESLKSTFRLYNKEVENVAKNTKKVLNVGNVLKSIAASLFTAIKVVKMVNRLVQESGEWIENLNLFAVTFGESNYREALDWATEYADKLGLANNEIVKMTGYFKQLSSAIGITGQQGTELSKILTQLGYDFGSFYNISFGSAFEKLQAGIFSGQVRTLRTLGIDVSQAAIQNLLDTSVAVRDLNASASQLTQTQKVLARTILTMQAGVNAFGDLARSMDTLQNRVRIFQASIENLKLAVGDLLSGYFSEFVAYGIAITQTITSIIRTIKPLQKELTYDIGDTVLGEIDEEAESAAEKINQLPFDKWISLTSGDSEQVDLTEALNKLLDEQIGKYGEISSQFDGIDERVKEIKDSILKWIFPNTTLEAISKSIDELGDGATLGEKFKVVLNEMNPALRGIFDIISKLIDLVKKIAPPLSKASKIILEIVGNIVTFLDKINLLYPVILALIGLKIYGKIEKLIEPISKIKTLSVGLSAAIAGLLAYNLADAFFGNFSKEAKVVVGLIGTLIAAFVSLAVAALAWQSAISLGVAIPIIVAAIAAGAAGIKAMVEGSKEIGTFANGGTPQRADLFYMNEDGIPEALVKTGSRETSVINIDQLSEGMRRGFVQAIYETGLNKKSNIIFKVDGNVNDSAFARAIFPALKVESDRWGGNQL